MKTLILILSFLSCSTEELQIEYCLPNYENTTKDFEYSVKEKIIFKTGKIYLEKAHYIDKMKSRFPDYLFFEVKPL